jgi:type I restriction enzyme M protein
VPVLGLIFLRYANAKFARAEATLKEQNTSGRRQVSKVDYQAQGVMYIPEAGRWPGLIRLPEGSNIGKSINNAIRTIEQILDKLPDAYLPEIYKQKCGLVYQHVYDSYLGVGKGIYSQ